MGLAIRELERGDGEWENIQDLAAKCSDQEAKNRGLQGHVDALARVVNTLSEELKQRAQDEQEQRLQKIKWMESMTHAVESQLQAVNTRVADVQNACVATVEKLERRVELVEEELGHLVNALDQKADVEVVQTHKKAVEDALKQRCRKTAVEKEVVRVHQMVRANHKTLTDRLDVMHQEIQSHAQIQSQMNEQFEQQQKQEPPPPPSVGGEEITCLQQQLTQLQEQVDAQTQSVTEQTLREWGETQHASIRSEWTHFVTENVKTSHDNVTRQLLAELETSRLATDDQIKAQQQQLADQQERLLKSHTEELMSLTVEPRLTQLEEQQAQAKQFMTQELARVDEATQALQRELQQLLGRVETVASECQARATVRDEWETQQHAEVKAKDKKTRHQMHLVADKLSEMDQILQLVGKQLVQNSSQLQLLWSDHKDEMSGVLMSGSGSTCIDALLQRDEQLKLMAEGPQAEAKGGEEGEDIQEPITITTTNSRNKQNEDEDAQLLVVQKNHHQELQDSIEAKLRDYQNVLLPHPTTT